MYIPITWHKGAILEAEVWLKLGGDKGGGTFKIIMFSGTSTLPTRVFSIFDAPDTYMNIKTGLQQHIDQINLLETHTWR